MLLSSVISHLSKTANSETNWSQGRPVHRPRLSHLQEKRLVRLLERRALEHHHAIGPLTRPQSAAAHAEVSHGQLLGCCPPRLANQFPGLPNPTELHLRRHQFDRVVLHVQRREQHHDRRPLIDYLADTRPNEFLARRRNAGFLTIERWQWGASLPFEKIIQSGGLRPGGVGNNQLWRCAIQS